MTKYSKQDLKEKAIYTLEAKNSKPVLYTKLIWALCIKTALTPEVIRQKIIALANT